MSFSFCNTDLKFHVCIVKLKNLFFIRCNIKPSNDLEIGTIFSTGLCVAMRFLDKIAMFSPSVLPETCSTFIAPLVSRIL